MDSAAWTALLLSLKVAGLATAIDLVLGVAVGWLLARKRFPGRELLDTVLTLPMVMPPTVLGYYLLVVIGRRGWVGGGGFSTSAPPPFSAVLIPQNPSNENTEIM